MFVIGQILIGSVILHTFTQYLHTKVSITSTIHSSRGKTLDNTTKYIILISRHSRQFFISLFFSKRSFKLFIMANPSAMINGTLAIRM